VLADGQRIVDARALVPAQLLATATPTAAGAIEDAILRPLRTHASSRFLMPCLGILVRHGSSAKSAARTTTAMSSRTINRWKKEIEDTTKRSFDNPLDAIWFAAAWMMEVGVREVA
jgi:hypothetical protein